MQGFKVYTLWSFIACLEAAGGLRQRVAHTGHTNVFIETEKQPNPLLWCSFI